MSIGQSIHSYENGQSANLIS
uniref:Uncharacterized protein n=1 Tax=Arundo donax TaxID=35708 RepID=A0A0A9BRR9_ARUDO